MEVFDYKNIRSLASVILWQYDHAENLQKLIWRVVREMDEDGVYQNVQKGLLQRMLDTATNAFDEFYTYIFSALIKAEEFENTTETSEDIASMNDVGKLYFGLKVWSNLTGVGRPQYAVTENPSVVRYNVPLLAWARYMRAELQRTFMRGTCNDINRYMKVLLPHYNVYVVDGGSSSSANYMTQKFKYRPMFEYDGTVVYEKDGYDTYGVVYSIDTDVSQSGEPYNRFVPLSDDNKGTVKCYKLVDYQPTGTVTTLEDDGSGTYSGGNFSWSADSSGLFKLSVTGESATREPTLYISSTGTKYDKDDNILLGAPDINTMMQKQYVDEYLLIQANMNVLIFPHAAGVYSAQETSGGSPTPAPTPGSKIDLTFGDITAYIGLNKTQSEGQNAAVLNHGIFYEKEES